MGEFHVVRPSVRRPNETHPLKPSLFIKKRKVKDAINYYKVVLDQNIPPEFKVMLRRNISDLTEYLERYLTGD